MIIGLLANVVRTTIITLLIMGLALLGQNSYPYLSLQTNPSQNQELLINAANKYQASVVTIYGYKRVGEESVMFGGISPTIQTTIGTGFIVSTNGTILTNKHVVADNQTQYRVTTNNGLRYEVVKIETDPTNDIAVVNIDPNQHSGVNLEAIPLGDSTEIKAGQNVMTETGRTPGEIPYSIKIGTVLGIRRVVVAGDEYSNSNERLKNVIQTNIDLIPGNSGSPLIDASGKVVGINTATSTGPVSMSFAEPINLAKPLLNGNT